MTPLSSISRERAGIRELRHEVRELRRANDRRVARSRRLRRRRFGAFLGAGLIVIVAVAIVNALSGSSDSRPVPNGASLTGLSTTQRIVAIAQSQVGYRTEPSHSYCNKFSAYWHAGTADCPGGEMSEKWCADFAAWVWQRAGVPFSYGFDPGQINAGAVSFYTWGVANGHWHPVASGYVPAPGDVAVYGLLPGAVPSAAHVAIVTATPRGQRGPDVVNGDGDRTGFSVVETGTDQTRADDGHQRHATLAGYVSPL
jgi:CHAP domain